jgi:hypothetical protein
MKLSKSKKIIFFIILFISFSAKSQIVNTPDSLIKAYEQGSIMLQNTNYVINGESYKMGFRERKIGETLKTNPMANAEFELFKKGQNKANVWNTVGLLAGLSSLLLVNQNTDKGLYTGLTVMGVGCLAVSIPMIGKSRKHFQKSVWIYNRDLLKK